MKQSQGKKSPKFGARNAEDILDEAEDDDDDEDEEGEEQLQQDD